MQQTTISREAKFSGVGLHLGQNVNMVFKSAPTNTGIVFTRVDIAEKPQIQANISNISFHLRRTTLAKNNVEIQTPEHLLSACHGLGINNLLIEMDGPEVPGADGSSLPFLEILRNAGIEKQDQNVQIITLKEAIEVKEDKAFIRAEPFDKLIINYTMDHDVDFLPRQTLELELTPENFIDHIAPARTFVLRREAEALKKMGIGKGANFQNTLVLDDNGEVVDNTLRFSDEFIRHKVLDLIGDLMLLGAPLHAKITAERSGHALNAKFVEKMIRTLLDN